jgi:Uncharacterized conserved protein
MTTIAIAVLKKILYSGFFFLINVELTFLLAALVCLLLNKKRLLWGITLVFLFIAAGPVIPRLVSHLEYTFEPPHTLPIDIDGIILLGGAFNRPAMQHTKHVVYSMAAGRILDFVALAKRYPHARLILSGGGGRIDSVASEAHITLEMMRNLGVDTARTILEPHSKNTFENAVFSKQLLAPQPQQKWVLVTSAIHMRRAVALFQTQGFNIIPYPVDYHSSKTGQTAWYNKAFLAGHGLLFWPFVMREIVGYWYSALTGEIKATKITDKNASV